MSTSPREAVTRILSTLAPDREPGSEDRQALFEAIYPELRRLAGGMMRSERPAHTLQPTALVHEAYLKLADDENLPWQSRGHFLAICARAMRQILVDHARRVSARKRGGDLRRVTLHDVLEESGAEPLEVLALHDALERFAAVDERAARVVEMKVFGGLEMKEIAQVLAVSERTVYGDWSMARMWLGRELGP